MKSDKIFRDKIFFILLFYCLVGTLAGCGGGGGGTSSSATTISANNVISLTVNGSQCDSSINAGYFNDPCVSVTVCNPGSTSTCQTINGILLDTGSYGLRIFKSSLGNVSPTQVPAGSVSLAEVTQFADGSSLWGPVQTVSVILGNEPSIIQVPIQVVDSTFAGVTSYPSNPALGQLCNRTDLGNLYYWNGSKWTFVATPYTTPSDAGFNGMLGVGPFANDCGQLCVSSSAVGQYYSCSGSTCSGTTVPLSNQVQNPVALLPTDNNGIIVQLPSISASGVLSVNNGSVIFGIGTQSNNSPSVVSPSGATAYPLDQYGDFPTIFNNVTYSESFIDTGSNGLYFPSSGLLTDCTGTYAGYFCPSSTTNLSATITGVSGSPSNTVQFQIVNTNTLMSSDNNVFDDIGADIPGQFDWGLPFYFGKNVFIGIEGQKSSFGTGPYFAY